MESRISNPQPLDNNPAEPARSRSVFDRIMQAAADNGDDLDRLSQALCVIIAETLGDLCSIQVLNQHNELIHLAGLYDPDPRALSLLQDAVVAMAEMPRDNGAAGQVIRTGEPLLMRTVSEEALRSVMVPEFIRYIDEVGMATAMAMPLKGRGGSIGVITVSRHRGRPLYTDEDLALLTDLSVRASVAIENVLLLNSLRTQVSALSSMQDALSASEERFRSLFESTTLGIEIMDPFGILLDTNRAFELMTGFSRADLAGRHFGALQHPDDAEALLSIMTGLRLNGQAAAPFENRIVRRDGSVIWVRTNFTAVRRGAGDQGVAFLVALHEDITSRKQAEQYFQAVLEATPDALVMVDADGRIMLVNRQLEQMFGYSRAEILGQHIERLVPERLHDRHPLLRQGYLLKPHTRPMGADLELFAVTKDGSEIPVEISLSPLHMDNATVVVAAIRDVTERTQRQAALLRSQRSLAEAQRVARLGSLEFDIATRTLEASDEALRIFGIQRAELHSSDTILEHTHPDDRQRVFNSTQAVLGSQTPQEFEFRVIHPDGSVHIVHDRVAMIPGPDGKPSRILGTVQDVTEQRQIQREMAELKSHLQSGVELERLRVAQDLHDGPMQDLYGASYRLDELRDTASPELRDALQDVSDQIQNSIQELRAIAKELRPPAISSFGLEKAIRSYVEDFHHKHPNIQLHLSLAQDHQLLPENMRITLFRVFQQALANILRHSHASEVRVRFSLDAEEVRLVVADNGDGFEVPSNWMGFVRHGHYGLAGAAERIDALGGILLVESHPKQGTTVTAIIPWTPGSNQ